MFIHETLQDRKQNHWTMKGMDLHSLVGQSLHHSDSLSRNLTFIHETHFKIWGKVNGLWNIGHCHQKLSQNMFIHQKVKIKGKINGPWNIGQCDLHLQCRQRSHHTDIAAKGMTFIHQTSLQDIRQNYRTMEYRSCLHIFIWGQSGSHWLIIRKYDVHPSNSRQNIKQNHWTVKYRSLTYIYFEVKSCITLTHYP